MHEAILYMKKSLLFTEFYGNCICDEILYERKSSLFYGILRKLYA